MAVWGALLGLVLILGLIVIWYLVWPWFKKIANAYHKMYIIMVKFDEADAYPGKTDDKGYAVLVTRYTLLSAIQSCLEEIKAAKVIIDGKVCTESCPAFSKITETLNILRVEQAEFLAKTMTLREGTQKEIDDVYARINQFIDNTLDKRDELFARVVAALERVSSERKNGGK
jgi:hypothetical protein